MKVKSLLICLSLLLNVSVLGQAISQTKYGDNDPTNLTDQDKDTSENFIHDGKAQRIYVEECTKSGETEEACLGQKANGKFMGMKSSHFGMLAKMYTMVIGMTDLGGGFATKGSKAATEHNDKIAAAEEKGTPAVDKNGKELKEKDADKKEQKDYCKYIPVATEAISMFNTQEDQKMIGLLPQDVETQQKDSLLKAAENHDSRAKTAKIQTVGWGAGSACYLAMVATPNVVWSWGLAAKLGASTVLAAFYNSQVGDHEDYADKTRAIAAKIPGKGDCNPITDKLCFCTEESSKKRPDYGKYCRPQLHNRRVAYKSERVTCIDENMKEDASCACAQRDTCVDKKVITTIKGFGGGTLGSSPMMADFSLLSKGELSARGLTSANNSINTALAKLRRNDKKIPDSNTILTDKQKEEFNLLKKMGMPPRLAKKMALTKITPEMKKNMAKFNGSKVKGRSKGYSRSGSRNKRSNVLTFSGGDGVNKQRVKKKSSSNDFLKRFGLKKKKRKKSSGKVLKFANRAQRQAQISNNKHKHIFDIISRRYQVSGWKRLQYIKD
jgi:hypothetical protein